MQTSLKAESQNSTTSSKGLDHATFAALYQDYSPALFGALIKVLKNKPLAEDALQNTFIKIWLYHSSYDSKKSSLFTWMLKIARHEAIDVLRSRQYRFSRLTTTLKGCEVATMTNTFLPIDHIDLQKQLCLLKPMDRAILELCFFRGFTCAETSEILNLPCGTVKTKMQRSYKVLKAILI